MPSNDEREHHMLIDTYLPTSVFFITCAAGIGSLTMLAFSFRLPSIDFGPWFYIGHVASVLGFAFTVYNASYKPVYLIKGKSSGGDSPRVLRYSSTKSRPQEVYVELEQ